MSTRQKQSTSKRPAKLSKKQSSMMEENKDEEQEAEGLQNFSNKLAEDIMKKSQEADLNAKYNPQQEEDAELIFAQYRNSIYNFNRKGISKHKARAKIYNGASHITSPSSMSDKNSQPSRQNHGVWTDPKVKYGPYPAYIKEEDDHAFKRYEDQIKQVKEVIKQQKKSVQTLRPLNRSQFPNGGNSFTGSSIGNHSSVRNRLSTQFGSTDKVDRPKAGSIGATLKLEKINIQDFADQGERMAIGQLLGRRVGFDNIEHASRTIMQLRQHGAKQQQLQKKQQILKLAKALDNQMSDQKSFSGLSPERNHFSKDFCIDKKQFEQTLRVLDMRHDNNEFNLTFQKNVTDRYNTGSTQKKKKDSFQNNRTYKAAKDLEPIMLETKLQINNSLKNIPMKFKQGSKQNHMEKLRQTHQSIQQVKNMHNLQSITGIHNGVTQLMKSPSPILTGDIVQGTIVRTTSNDANQKHLNSHVVSGSLEKLNVQLSKALMADRNSQENPNRSRLISNQMASTYQSNLASKGKQASIFSDYKPLKNPSELKQSGMLHKTKAYPDNFRNQRITSVSLKKAMNQVGSLQYLDAPFDDDNLNSRDNFAASMDVSLQYGFGRRDAQYMRNGRNNLTQESSTVNLGAGNNSASNSLDNIDIQDQADYNKCMTVNSNNPFNEQPSIKTVLDSAQFQFIQNVDQTYRLTHMNATGRLAPGTNKVPNIKVTKKKDNNQKVGHMVKILQPRIETESPSRKKRLSVGTGTVDNSVDKEGGQSSGVQHSRQDDYGNENSSTHNTNINIELGNSSTMRSPRGGKKKVEPTPVRSQAVSKLATHKDLSPKPKVSHHQSDHMLIEQEDLSSPQQLNLNFEIKTGTKTVQEYEQEKQQAEIIDTLKNISCIREINHQFGQLDNDTGQRNEDSHTPDGERRKLLIPHTKRYFERFHEVKQDIKDYHLKLIKDEHEKKLENADLQTRRNVKIEEVVQQKNYEMVYNQKYFNEDRIKIFLGEGGQLLKTGFSSAIYHGGFMGNQFNFRLGDFSLFHNPSIEEESLKYEGSRETNDISIARMGHVIFYDYTDQQFVIFGGQRSGDKYKQTNQRLIMNDVIIYDPHANRQVENIQFSEGAVASRIYSCGFKIDSKIYIYGGMGTNGQLINTMTEIDYKKKKSREVLFEKGRSYLEAVHSAAMTPVFYKQKLNAAVGVGDLKLSQITQDINWGEATELIKYEGFYMFGGRKPDNSASQQLTIFKPELEKKSGPAQTQMLKFRVIRPKTQGVPPAARYMHSVDYIADLGVVVVYGGRNDFEKAPVLNDVYALKLYNLEWIRVMVGGRILAIPRCNHSSLVNGTELIICGGQNPDFSLEKSIFSMEFNQSKIDRTNPIMVKFQKGLNKQMKTFDVKKFIDTTHSRSLNNSPNNSQGSRKVEDSPTKKEDDKVPHSQRNFHVAPDRERQSSLKKAAKTQPNVKVQFGKSD